MSHIGRFESRRTDDCRSYSLSQRRWKTFGQDSPDDTERSQHRGGAERDRSRFLRSVRTDDLSNFRYGDALQVWCRSIALLFFCSNIFIDQLPIFQSSEYRSADRCHESRISQSPARVLEYDGDEDVAGADPSSNMVSARASIRSEKD